VEVMLFHPEVAFRDCNHCLDYLYDEKTGKVKMFHGEAVERLPSVPAPCHCKGCPKGTPEDQKVLRQWGSSRMMDWLDSTPQSCRICMIWLRSNAVTISSQRYSGAGKSPGEQKVNQEGV